MAKLCPNCNLKYKNDAHKCVQCGAELEAIKKDARRKKILIISILSILLIGLIVAAILFFTGPKAKVRSIMRAFKKGDKDAIVATFPEFLVESGELDDYIKYQLPDSVKFFSETKFSYQIDRVANPSNKEKETFLFHLKFLEKYGYDPDKLQDVKVVFFTMKGVNPGEWFKGFNKFILIKYDGTWYWWPFDY